MIETVIHVHNRTQYLERAVEAAVSSARAADAVVRISCNASDASAREAAQRVAQRYGVDITHSLATSAFEHFYASVAASKAEHVCLLHDDDFVALRYFHLLQQLIVSHPSAAGYAPGNSFLIAHRLHQASVSPRRPFRLSSRWLALLYLMGRCGPPFPSILYRRDFALAAFSAQPMFDKYSDAPIVMKAAREGLWIDPEMAFTYVIGEQNDSRVVDLVARRGLKRWLWHQLLNPVISRTAYSTSNLFYFLGRFLKFRSSLPIQAPP